MSLPFLSRFRRACPAAATLFAISFLAVGCTGAPAGSDGLPKNLPDFEGRIISSVEVHQTGPVIEDARLRSHIVERRNQPYRGARVDDGVKSLYESGMVDDVHVLVEPQGDRVKLTYRIQTRGPLR
jgi:hypothetical protein